MKLILVTISYQYRIQTFKDRGIKRTIFSQLGVLLTNRSFGGKYWIDTVAL